MRYNARSMRVAIFGAFATAAFVACSSGGGATLLVSVGQGVVFPHGYLDQVKKLSLLVYEASDGVDCRADGYINRDDVSPVASENLSSSGCANGVKFCGDLSLAQSANTRVFLALGYDGSDNRLVNGCTKAVIDHDQVEVDITLRRFIEPAVCGDGRLEPTEQCETTDPICDHATCTTTEIYLSDGKGPPQTNTSPGKTGEKTDPFLLWPVASGDDGRFVAFFSDATPPQFQQVTLRVRSDGFAPYAAGGADMQNFSFFLPNDATTFPPSPVKEGLSVPAAVFDGKQYDVVFERAAGNPDIGVRAISTAFHAPGNEIIVNGNNGEPGGQRRPAIARGENGALFVAWHDEPSGQIVGRTLDALTLQPSAPQHALSTGSNNVRVSLAALPGSKGAAAWVATWRSGTTIKMRMIDSNGVPLGDEQIVSSSAQAEHGVPQVMPSSSVASLSDGRFAIVWAGTARDGGDIYLQRYSAQGQPIAGDAATPINDTLGDGVQSLPVIAGEPSSGGSYVAAWVDEASGEVRARFIGGSAGFLFNHVDGQESEFQASVMPSRKRTQPAVAVGGAAAPGAPSLGGPYVVIGWQDATDSSPTDTMHPGIYARRFPMGE